PQRAQPATRARCCGPNEAIGDLNRAMPFPIGDCPVSRRRLSRLGTYDRRSDVENARRFNRLRPGTALVDALVGPSPVQGDAQCIRVGSPQAQEICRQRRLIAPYSDAVAGYVAGHRATATRGLKGHFQCEAYCEPSVTREWMCCGEQSC